jgi:hypothetical protein
MKQQQQRSPQAAGAMGRGVATREGSIGEKAEVAE